MSELSGVLLKALMGKFDEVSVLVEENHRVMVKLWNTEPSVTQSWLETNIHLRLAKSGRLWVLSYEARDPVYILKHAENLLKIADRVEQSELYAPLPEPGVCKPLSGVYDGKVESYMDDPSGLVGEIIDSSISQGVDRVAGALTLTKSKITLVNSRGFECEEYKTSVEAYARAFKGDYSGHWAYGQTGVNIQAIREVGRKAGYYASITSKRVDVSPGEYRVAVSPLVVGNLFNYLSFMSSALYVLIGFSVFAKYRPGEKIGSENVSLYDKPRDTMLPGARGFDDEGVETFDKPIIEHGVVKNILHNTGTASKMQAKSTGNAGWIYPSPWNLEIASGDLKEEEIPSVLGSGLIILNNWYTRLQNYYEGYFSTVSRDMALLVKNGEIEGHVGRVRIATSFPRLLNNVIGVSRERYDISWWEVRIPARAPFMILENIQVTKPEV